jgi:hypothetical protein
MKKVIFTLILFGIMALNSNATVRTVSNDVKAPAQYTSINTAIQASSFGDTIIVYGSATTWTTVNVDREVVLIGAGYNNPYGAESYITTLTLDGINTTGYTASNTKVSGFTITNLNFYGHTNTAELSMEGVLIERCRLGRIYFNQGNVTYRNDTIRNCFLKDNNFYLTYGLFQNIQIHNNIFDNMRIGKQYAGATSHDSVYLRNCVFVNRSASDVFYQTNDLTVENCIFYAAQPQGCTNCAFNNNMTYLNTNNVLLGTGNPGSVGSGNHEDEDPLFVIYPAIGGAFSYSHDLNVQSTNAINGGTDASDIGIHGGMLPYSPGDNPAIPQMTEITFPENASSVKVGGTLDVTFKANKQD